MGRALVTGGNGFIGSHLVDALIDEGWEVLVLDLSRRRYDPLPPTLHFMQGDMNQVALLREALTGVDVVFHLAWASIHETSNRNLVEDVQANLISSIRLLESCVWADVQRVVFISSGGTVYGPAQEIPISEDHPKNPINAYGVHKLAVEKYLQLFRHLHDLEYMILRPSVPYGPRQNPFGKQGAVAVFMYRIWQELSLELWGDGSTTRDFFYISDLVRAAVSCAEQPTPAQAVFNIGGEDEISLLELIECIEAVTGKGAEVAFRPAREFDAPRILLDTGRAEASLGWSPQVNLREGLELTWQWMQSSLP